MPAYARLCFPGASGSVDLYSQLANRTLGLSTDLVTKSARQRVSGISNSCGSRNAGSSPVGPTCGSDHQSPHCGIASSCFSVFHPTIMYSLLPMVHSTGP